MPHPVHDVGSFGEHTFWEVGWTRVSQARDVAAGLFATSLHDAERKMRDPSALDYPGALQLYRLGAQMVEQTDAVL